MIGLALLKTTVSDRCHHRRTSFVEALLAGSSYWMNRLKVAPCRRSIMPPATAAAPVVDTTRIVGPDALADGPSCTFIAPAGINNLPGGRVFYLPYCRCRAPISPLPPTGCRAVTHQCARSTSPHSQQFRCHHRRPVPTAAGSSAGWKAAGFIARLGPLHWRPAVNCAPLATAGMVRHRLGFLCCVYHCQTGPRS